jgi:hypothetical protein
MAKGIYDKTSDFIDSIIIDLNSAIKEIVTGQYINACASVNSIAQKLINLRTTFDDELKHKNELIDTLKGQLSNMGAEYEEMTPEEFINKYGKKDGANNGSN